MDRPLIEKKLESLRRCLVRIREKCPASAEALAQTPDAQDIVVLNLTRAVQLCVDIGLHVLSEQEAPPPETMGDTFDSPGPSRHHFRRSRKPHEKSCRLPKYRRPQLRGDRLADRARHRHQPSAGVCRICWRYRPAALNRCR